MTKLLKNTLTEITRDTMPKEVATAMLCAPKAKLSNTMRKQLRDARATYYAPVMTPQAPKPLEDKLKARFGCVSMQQLGKWRVRTVFHRGRIQAEYVKTEQALFDAEQKNPGKNHRLEAALDHLAKLGARLDTHWEALDNEIERRIAGPHTV